VTIPRRGTLYEARQFAAAHVDWLAGQLRRFAERSGAERIWVHGTEILFRGRLVALELPSDGTERALLLGAETIALPLGAQPERPEQGDLRAVVEAHLRRLADTELPGRALELAALHGCVVCEINVRNQRTRWG
jgi:predicted metal-dependent hydrolase